MDATATSDATVTRPTVTRATTGTAQTPVTTAIITAAHAANALKPIVYSGLFVPNACTNGNTTSSPSTTQPRAVSRLNADRRVSPYRPATTAAAAVASATSTAANSVTV